MTECERQITKEQYDRAMLNHRFITDSDMQSIFNVNELYGYGVYRTRVYSKGDEYYVVFSLGSSCD